MTLPIGFLGAGQMASALAAGWSQAGLLEVSRSLAADPFPAARDKFTQTTGVKSVATNREVAAACDWSVLGSDVLAGGGCPGLAGVFGVCAARDAAATREAASGSQRDGDNVFIFMILGDPVCRVRGGSNPSQTRLVKALMPPMRPTKPTYVKDDFTCE